MLVTRFAPSPTGLLHLGHAYAALYAWSRARQAGGRFLLRIEDIDAARCREEFVAAIDEDLRWLGLDWDGAVRRQSRHLDDYRAALARLEAAGLVYPCFCTRADIAGALDAPQGPEGAIYPGTCRDLPSAERAARMAAGVKFALRLDTAAAFARTGKLAWEDEAAGLVAADPLALGDVVLARKDAPTSYHLAVTIDDAAQGVSLVTRGIDLFAATHIHRLLQALLGLPTPLYSHHRLLVDASGRRYAKRDRSLTLRALRQSGRSPEEVRAMAASAAT
ncbi:MAG TPA: tRNA glutamyl-Q(34) synthetase GluQRS [Stellaceae bacterium]|nr:tRNA glutamyl-Q(34) synthetase GluQRS [Stellaceae bacterium]